MAKDTIVDKNSSNDKQISHDARTINLMKFNGSENYIYKDCCDYNEVFSISNFYDRGLECCKDVRWKRSTTEFELDLFCIVTETLNKIEANKYRAKPFNNFVINERGKTRQISAQKIVDRMVQKVINQDVMLPIYAVNFVEGNSASMKGKGKQWAIDVFLAQLYAHYMQYGIEGGILLGDYSNYFGSLPHEELKRRIRERITDPRAVKILCDAITDFRKIAPCHKVEEWGYAGIGLGSEVSQTFALDYATPLDHYIEDNFDISGYGRYMDDFYIICSSLETLHELNNILEEMVKEMGVALSTKKTKIVPFKAHSFTFLKMDYLFTSTGAVLVLPCAKNKKVIRTRLKKFRDNLDKGIFTIEDVCASYNGWRANIVNSKNSYKTVYCTDIYFINLFRQELANMKHPFKCYIKSFKDKDGKWQYVTKELKGCKHFSKRQKRQIKEKKKKQKMNQTDTNKTNKTKKQPHGRFVKYGNDKINN